MAKTYTTTSSNGTTYKVGSQKALDFIDSANIGATMVGGDGSKWVKNADGSTTVTDKNGVTSTFNAGRYDYSNDTGLESSDAVSGITRNVTGTPYAQTGRSISGQPTINFGTDTTDYATRASNAQSRAELESWLSKLELQGTAQGRDTSAQVDQILTDWYARNGNRLDEFRNVTDHETGSGLTYAPGEYARVTAAKEDGSFYKGMDDTGGRYVTGDNTLQQSNNQGITIAANTSPQSSTAYSGGNSPQSSTEYSGGNSLLEEYYNLYGQNGSYADALSALQEAQAAATQKAVNALETQKTDTNNTYNQYFRQAYIDRMNAQKDINQRMAAQGITGGAAESTLLGLSTAYSDALRNMERGRMQDIAALDQAITDTRLTGDIAAANAVADATRERTASYANALQNLINRQDALTAQQEAYAREDAAAARSWAQQLAMNALNNGYMPDAETLSRAGMSSSYASALLDAINREKARENAEFSAQYGDYSGLSDLGVNTDYLTRTQAAQLAELNNTRSTATPSTQGTTQLTSGDLYQRLADSGATNYATAYEILRNSGYSITDANRYANGYAEIYNNTIAQQGTTQQEGGLSNDVFNQEGRAIVQYLQQGNAELAVNRIDRIWSSLSQAQRDTLQGSLAQYGVTYNPA